MSTIEPTVLVHMNKSFNPFRSAQNAQSPSSSSAAAPARPAPAAPEQRQEQDDTPNNDSWHTNPPYISIQPQTSKNFSPPSSPTVGSWFSGWTSSAKPKSPKPMKRSVPASTGTAVDDHSAENNSTSIPHPAVTLSSQLAPAVSMTMNRGATISPRQEVNVSHNIIMAQSSSMQNGIGRLAVVTGGCMIIPPNGSRFPTATAHITTTTKLRIETSIDGNDTQIEVFDDLPPYPDLGDPQSHTIAPPPRTSETTLIEPFPSSTPSAIVGEKSTSVATATPTRRETSQRQPKLIITPDSLIDREESTFPGFSLLQMATAQYCQGKFSQALDTTTECLAFQKSYFSHEGGGGGGNAAPVSPKGMTSSTTESISASTVGKVFGSINGSNSLTPFDSRSSFAAQLGSSVLGVVRSLKTEVPSSKEQQAARHQHPMLSNTVSAMISQYPTKHCVVKTLLLRGHVLVACGLHGNDRSLMVQATKNVEMAVAIQRKLAIDRELAASLIFLGVLKSRMGHFCEADNAFKEAFCILREIRRLDKSAHPSETLESECTEEESNRRTKVDDEIAHALYLHGKSLHCQRMYIQAFHYYNRAFQLCKRSGSTRNNSASVKNIVRCMKKSCALEKLVSAYWDDAAVV